MELQAIDTVRLNKYLDSRKNVIILFIEVITTCNSHNISAESL